MTSESPIERMVRAAPGRHGAAPSLLAVGDNVVDRYVEAGYMYPGGNAVNVAVHARRNGATSAYLGAVGTDRAGQVVLAALEEEGVDTTLTRQVDGPNAYADVRVVDGNRVFGGADVGISRFSLGRDDLTAAAAFDIVHTGECSMVEEQLQDLADAARGLSFDFSERPWDYVQTHAPQGRRRHLVHARRGPGGSRGPCGPPPRARPLRRRDHAGRRRCGAAARRGRSPTARSRRERSWTPSGPETPSSPGSWSASRPPSRWTRSSATRPYATASCASYGAFGHRTPLHGHAAELDPIRNGRLDLR